MAARQPIGVVLSSLCAMSLMTSPRAEAVQYMPGPSFKNIWYISGFPSGVVPQAMCISKGRMYILKGGTSSTMYYSTNTTASALSSGTRANSWSSFSLGIGTTGAIGSDSKGNIAVAATNNAGVRIYPAGATSTANSIGLTYVTADVISGTVPFLAVAGDLKTTDATRDNLAGGFLHILPNGSNNLYRPQIYNKSTVYSKKYFTAEIPDGLTINSGAYAKPSREDKEQVLIHTGGLNNRIIHYRIPVNKGNANGTSKSQWEYVYELPKSAMSATIVGSGDKMFYVYASGETDGWLNKNAKFIVQNAHDPLLRAEYSMGAASTGDINTQSAQMVGCWIEAEFSDDGNKLYVYAMQPGRGAWCQEISIVELQSTMNVAYDIQGPESGQENRVDAVFTWTPNANYRQAFQRLSNKGVWETIAEVDRGIGTYTLTNACKSETYRIAILSNDGVAISLAGAQLTTAPPFLPTVPVWEEGYKAPNGYALVYLNWDTPYGHIPAGYNIYRDNVLIEERYNVSNYVDRNVPEGTHSYTIESVYLDDNGNPRTFSQGATTYNCTSAVKTVEVAPIDLSFNQYEIETIYNVPIDEAFDAKEATNALSDADTYRQGVYYNGYWYLYQMSNLPALTAGNKGGVVRIDASKTTAAEMLASARYVYETDTNVGLGIAVDDAGNFFINHQSYTQDSHYKLSNYALPMLKGDILRLKSDGDLELVNTIDFEHKIPFAERTIYYSMTGNVMSEDGGYLYLSEFDSRSMYRVHLKLINGVVDIADWTKFDHSDQDYEAPVKFIQSCVIPVDGTSDKVLHNIRYGAYYSVDFSKGSPTATPTFAHQSLIKSIGGATYWFNNRMFLLAPNDEYLHSTGNFFVGIAGSSEDGYGIWSDAPENCEFDYDKIMPVITYSQPDQTDKILSNSGAAWFACEPIPAREGGRKGFYIYQYVPGIRFAKYALSYAYEMPEIEAPEVTTQLNYEYDEDGNPIDIASMSATASWNTLQNYGQANSDTDSYRTVLCYQLDLLDTDDKVITSSYIDATGEEADSSILTNPDESQWLEPTTEETLSHTIDNIDNSDLKARLTVHFLNQNTIATATSEPSHQEVPNVDYEVQPAHLPDIRVVYKTIRGSYFEDLKELYRIDIDFQRPIFIDSDEPVSYYQIETRHKGDAEWTVLDNIQLVTPATSGQMKAPRKVDLVEADDKIPGTYDFDNSRSKLDLDSYDNKEAVAVAYLTYDLDENLVPADDPTKWEYRVVAHYGANATVLDGLSSIAKTSTTTTLTPSQTGGIITGVDEIEVDDVNETWYNLQGMPIANPAPGQILIRRSPYGTAKIYK